MRVVFTSGERYLPGSVGGAEVTIDELARELIARGHTCEVVAKVGDGAARLRHRLWRFLGRGKRAGREDLANGYPTYRALRGDVRRALGERIRASRPDVVLTWNGQGARLSDDAAAAGIPAILWVPDLTPRPEMDETPPSPAVRIAGSSRFVASRLESRFSRPVAVLRPFIRLDAYRVGVHRPEYVTLVNPQAAKGVDVALAVAKLLPERRFQFVVPRGFAKHLRGPLESALETLPNIRLRGPTRDMREIYESTAVLLVPSQCEDASPRVVLEAHVNGIPVVASAIGGIPEVSGGASILLPPDAPASAWSEAVSRLLTDASAREEISRRSRENAAREELGPEAIVELFLRIAQASGSEAPSVPAPRT